MPPILLAFLDCFALSALAAASIVVASLVLFALLLFFVGCVVVGSFSLRMIATKKKGQAVGACMGVPGASAQVAHYHTKIAHFRHFGAIAFFRSSQISVLRAF